MPKTLMKPDHSQAEKQSLKFLQLKKRRQCALFVPILEEILFQAIIPYDISHGIVATALTGGCNGVEGDVTICELYGESLKREVSERQASAL